jgi:hypothetical protein
MAIQFSKHNPASDLEEFTLLFMALELVVLSDQLDTIKWKWTLDGNFSVASTYECQFLGAVQKILAMDVWRTSAEPRSKFFAWLVLHNRVLTPDNMIIKN